MSKAYYNEFDPFAAEWLKMLIVCGHIADGDVDTRSIEDVRPNDLRGYTQVHLFAGIGGWSRAFRLAGVPDSYPLWSCSCPCQPFSAAGKGGGFADERHLWPAAHYLITQLEPHCIVGEQVAAKSALAWIDLVQTDMEASEYAFGKIDLCAAGIGAPHIRQRLYWGANTMRSGWPERWAVSGDRPAPGGSRTLISSPTNGGLSRNGDLQRSGQYGLLAETGGFGVGSDANSSRRGAGWSGQESDGRGQTREQLAGLCSLEQRSNAELPRASRLGEYCGTRQAASRLRDGSSCTSISGQRVESLDTRLQVRAEDTRIDRPQGWLSASEARSASEAGATRGFWSGADWWHGTDEKFRPIEPGLFPLAHGVSKRMGRLRGYGNAIVPQIAAEFVKAYMEIMQ